jgi:hypothetical protein
VRPSVQNPVLEKKKERASDEIATVICLFQLTCESSGGMYFPCVEIQTPQNPTSELLGA